MLIGIGKLIYHASTISFLQKGFKASVYDGKRRGLLNKCIRWPAGDDARPAGIRSCGSQCRRCSRDRRSKAPWPAAGAMVIVNTVVIVRTVPGGADFDAAIVLEA